MKNIWPLRDSNTQPSDLESDALPLRQGVLLILGINEYCIPRESIFIKPTIQKDIFRELIKFV